MVHDGATAIRDSLIRLTGQSGTGVRVLTYGGHSSVTADGVTIVTPPSLDFGGVSVSTANAPASSVDVSLTNSIIRGPAYPLLANAAGTGEAKVNASYSDYDVNGDVTLGANATISEANVTNVGDAGFVAAGAGDYHLRPGSPLIDAGDPATAQGHDLDGNPLVTDGNRDGIARRDMGAFELQPPASAGGGQTGAGAVQQDGTPPSDTQSPLVNGFRAAPSVFAIAPAATPLAARLARHSLPLHAERGLARDPHDPARARRPPPGREVRAALAAAGARQGLHSLPRRRDPLENRQGRREQHPLQR
jgi:hypothetical protein